MFRARVRYAEGSNRVMLTYYLPGGWFAPLVGLWCIAGGLAVGIGVAVALTVAGLVDTHTFRLVLIVVTGIMAVTLYAAGYLRALRTRFLRITFDYARRLIGIHPAYANQRPVWYAFEDVHAFRLIDRSNAWRVSCALLMEPYDGEPETLLVLNRPCDDEQTALPHFVTRLEAQLEVDLAVEDDLPPLPWHVTPPVPARRGYYDQSAELPGEPNEPYDVYDDQQPSE
jgi:hypothetical protein